MPKAEDVQESIGRGEPGSPEVSVVIPCLNEAETLATCIEKAARAMREHDITGEIVVADNGSSDDSRAIARRLSAIVVDVESKGYGHALMGGIVFSATKPGPISVFGDQVLLLRANRRPSGPDTWKRPEFLDERTGTSCTPTCARRYPPISSSTDTSSRFIRRRSRAIWN